MNTASPAEKPIVDPGLYSRDYFLGDNEGWREYRDGLDSNIHPKFARVLELAGPVKGLSVLDIGCGRGELLYYSARQGAGAVLGLDYSSDAVAIARQTIESLPAGDRGRARAEVGEAASYDFKERFDLVFIVETLEHMHDWQIERTIESVGRVLNRGGRIIMITPNFYYEKYLCPMKRVLAIPLNVLKLPFRLFKPRYRAAGIGNLLRKTFRISADRGELNRRMHVNVTTPATVRRFLKGFDTDVRCEDRSKNILTMLTGRWWGRDIVAVARKA